MKQTPVLIIGASVSGLAMAACLQKQGIEYIIIEKESEAGAPWHKHYDRLHLHTNKGLSNLPYKKFGRHVPRYPSRKQVIDYLSDYQKEFNIDPVLNTKAETIKKDGNDWITETSNGIFHSAYLVMATGVYAKPKTVYFKGMETFTGSVLHSTKYKTGSDFKDQKVLVVGFGNSACEIAIDLYEQGAAPSMVVRSPVNVIPRDIFGIPILRLSMYLSRLPPRLADWINAPLLRLLTGNITRLGLKKMPYGTFEQIKKDGKIPLIDIGTIRLIRQGRIKIYNDIDHISGETVHFADGKKQNFDAIVTATGFNRNYSEIMNTGKERFEDLKVSVHKQKYFGRDGLYFCGFWISPRGMFHEIALDAQKIAKDIGRKERLAKLYL